MKAISFCNDVENVQVPSSVIPHEEALTGRRWVGEWEAEALVFNVLFNCEIR